jgi:glycosyltransferase involved in cell wall biosynthesis
MACGTPVVAFRRGSVPEVVDDAVTGRIVETTEEAVAVLPEVLALDRQAVRARFEERFSASRMARDYVKLYHALLGAPTPYHVGERRIGARSHGGRLNGNGKGSYAD